MSDAGRTPPNATAPPPKGRRNATDWDSLRVRYATGTESLGTLAEATGLDRTTVAKHASRDGWVAAREAHRTSVATAATAQAAKAAAAAASAPARSRIASEAMIDAGAHRAAQGIARVSRRILRQIGGDDAKVSLEDAPRLKALVETLEKAHRLARVTAHLAAEPVAAVSESTATVIVRTRDEHGDVTDGDDDGRPVGLPPDPDRGEVPPQS